MLERDAEQPWLPLRVGGTYSARIREIRKTGDTPVYPGTLVLAVVLYVFVSKGFFPIQDTGVIQGISDAEQTVSFSAMAERQQRMAELLLQDPAVQSLSSFIGVDGANATLNAGRMLINLKPHGQRRESALAIIDRLRERAPDRR